ncbi:MAG TPA: GNAT family N-acetyltransferase [Usitatibacter sp.]|nr:GNAT family N-acetyltransferase [Usitatibacter sp.]
MSRDIPTVRLHALDRGALLHHFLSLDREDRRLRFGNPIADEGIEAYVKRIDFERDGLFAVHDDNLEMVAMVHVAIAGKSAELGLSVLPGWRDKGYGNVLLRRAVVFLRNRAVDEVFVHCLSENGAMMHLARKNGMRIAYSGGESDARLVLDPATADSFIAEWLDDQRGLTLRNLRQGARNARALFGVVTN